MFNQDGDTVFIAITLQNSATASQLNVRIKIFFMSTTDNNLAGIYKPTPKEEVRSGYEHFIHQEFKSLMELYSVSLPKIILTHVPVSQPPAQMIRHIVVSTDANGKLEAHSNILHPLCPGT